MFHRSSIGAALLLAAAAPGQDWYPESPTQAPAARRFHSLDFDASRGLSWLFGGVDEQRGQSFADTWSYDGHGWRQVQAPGPAARSRHASCCHPKTGHLLVFGGVDAQGRVLDDTWVFDGTQWQQISNPQADAPAARADAAMCHDAVGDRILLFGGRDPATGKVYADTWQLDANGWQVVGTSRPMTGRFGHAMGYLPGSKAVVLFGGRAANAGQFDAETWQFHNDVWTRRNPGTVPPAMVFPEAAYDAHNGVLLVVGDVGGSSAKLETWEFDGLDWRPGRKSPQALSGRQGQGLTYDARRGAAVLFGGGAVTAGGIRPLRDTWELSIEARFLAVGDGCPNLGGTLELRTAAKPSLGRECELILDHVPLAGIPLLLVGDSIVQPKPLFHTRFGPVYARCPLRINVLLPLLMKHSGIQANLRVAVPEDSSLLGAELALQGWVLGWGGGHSNAGRVILGN